jgi:hypothetical protein
MMQSGEGLDFTKHLLVVLIVVGIQSDLLDRIALPVEPVAAKEDSTESALTKDVKLLKFLHVREFGLAFINECVIAIQIILFVVSLYCIIACQALSY